MNTEMNVVVFTFLLTVVLAYPFGRYIAKVFKGERTLLDFLSPVERVIYRVCGIGSIILVGEAGLSRVQVAVAGNRVSRAR